MIIQRAHLEQLEDFLSSLSDRINYYNEIYGNKQRALMLLEDLENLTRAIRRGSRSE